MKAVYERAGIPLRPFVPDNSNSFPAFEAIEDELKADNQNRAILGRMSPIFDLGLFSSDGDDDFHEFAKRRVAIRLAHLPGDEIKNAVAEFFLMALHSDLLRQPASF